MSLVVAAAVIGYLGFILCVVRSALHSMALLAASSQGDRHEGMGVRENSPAIHTVAAPAITKLDLLEEEEALQQPLLLPEQRVRDGEDGEGDPLV